MKHLKKFNESESTKYKMELKDYFYDLDMGFTIDIEDNVIKGKYKGNIDSKLTEVAQNICYTPINFAEFSQIR
jgi:hypothetical protein